MCVHWNFRQVRVSLALPDLHSPGVEPTLTRVTQTPPVSMCFPTKLCHAGTVQGIRLEGEVGGTGEAYPRGAVTRH